MLRKCEQLLLLLSFLSQLPFVSLFKLDFLFNVQDYNHSPWGQKVYKLQIKTLHFEARGGMKKDKMLGHIPDSTDIYIMIMADITLQGNICLILTKRNNKTSLVELASC